MKTTKPQTAVQLLYKNRLIENIYEACTCCYDNTKSISYIEKKDYIARRVKAGHESVLEHGRLAIFISSNKNIDEEIAALTTMDASRDLTFYCDKTDKDTFVYVIGNMRFFKYFVENVYDSEYDNNFLVRGIISVLKENTPKELYGNLNREFISVNDFIDIEPDISNAELELKLPEIKYEMRQLRNVDMDIAPETHINCKSILLGIDNIKLKHLMESHPSDVVLDIIPVTVLFNNASRTATHQIVRHRNAITQESQRYVDYSQCTFTIPMENYDKDKKYNISIFGQTVSVSLESLANWLIDIYPQLVNQGLKKEEARAFLPSNVNCKRLYMTFSLRQLYHFIDLRTDPHAQYEIRKYAEAIKDALNFILNISN
jgi:thymidylate synthase (FAD)